MKKIEVEKQSDNLWQITLEDGQQFCIDTELLYQFSVLDKEEISDTLAEKLIQEQSVKNAYQRALYWLNFRMYSYKALFLRLNKEFPEDICYIVLNRLAQRGIINDRKYAQQLAEYYVKQKYYGVIRVANILKEKQLPQIVITETLAPYIEHAQPQLMYLLRRKYAKKLTDAKDINSISKVKASLVRRGFYFEDINEAIKNYFLQQGE